MKDCFISVLYSYTVGNIPAVIALITSIVIIIHTSISHNDTHQDAVLSTALEPTSARCVLYY